MKCAARDSLKIQNTKIMPKIAICATSHNLVGYIFTTKAHINNQKKNLLYGNYVVHMSSQYAELWPISG